MDRMVECELARIIINENSDQQYIWLREKDGGRHFPIVIAIMEALAIDRFVKEQVTQRPLTHELMHRILEAMGVHVERVEVTKLQEHTFYANVVLVRDGEQFEVDARPSDAIALAMRNDTTILVHEDVLEEVSSSTEL